jgi:hypothetical protein
MLSLNNVQIMPQECCLYSQENMAAFEKRDPSEAPLGFFPILPIFSISRSLVKCRVSIQTMSDHFYISRPISV